jgi:hypothetical protein
LTTFIFADDVNFSTAKASTVFFAEAMEQTFQIMQAKPRQESLRP